MLPDRRAVVFDLDDTLYPYRRFVLSGFAAVARHLEQVHGADSRHVLHTLIRAFRGPERHRALQVCLEQNGLPAHLFPSIVAVFRNHEPALRLPMPAARVLRSLRESGWRIGILTNGPRSIQARKIAALGIGRFVDSIVYATDYGSGAGKPEHEPFVEVLRRLGVSPDAAVFVGNDEECDIGGAIGAGITAVRCVMWQQDVSPSAADAVIDCLSQLPPLAQLLLEEAATRHAA